MKKYVTPTIETADIETSDLILASAYQVMALEGVDENGSKSAVFDASLWFF